MNVPSKSEFDLESEHIRALRANSANLNLKRSTSFVKPQILGLIYLRSSILKGLILVTLLAAVLMIPRLYITWVRQDPARSIKLTIFIVGALCAFIALAYIRLQSFSNRASLKHKPDLPLGETRFGFFAWGLFPLLLFAICFTTFWAWMYESEHLAYESSLGLLQPFVIFWEFLYLVSWLAAALWLKQFNSREFLRALLAGTLAGVFTWLLFMRFLPNVRSIPGRSIYVCFSIPILLAVVILAETLSRGIVSGRTTDYDREW
jgi:hypothetical protein